MGNSLYLTSASIQELHIHQTTHPPLIHTTHEDYGIDYCNGDDDGNDDNGGNGGVNDGGSNNGDDKKMMAVVIMMVVMMKLMTTILMITTMIMNSRKKKMMILMILFPGIAYSSNHTATSHSQHHPLTIQFLGC